MKRRWESAIDQRDRETSGQPAHAGPADFAWSILPAQFTGETAIELSGEQRLGYSVVAQAVDDLHGALANGGHTANAREPMNSNEAQELAGFLFSDTYGRVGGRDEENFISLHTIALALCFDLLEFRTWLRSDLGQDCCERLIAEARERDAARTRCASCGQLHSLRNPERPRKCDERLKRLKEKRAA